MDFAKFSLHFPTVFLLVDSVPSAPPSTLPLCGSLVEFTEKGLKNQDQLQFPVFLVKKWALWVRFSGHLLFVRCHAHYQPPYFFYYTVPKPIPSLKSHFVEPLRVIFGPYYGQKFLTYVSLEEKKREEEKEEKGEREGGKKGGGEKEGT